jgi:membrane dipeptidase
MSRFADFLAFPFPQSALLAALKHGVALPETKIALDLFHVTSVPPVVTTIDQMLSIHHWFQAEIARQDPHGQIIYGLQHPPVEVDRIAALATAGVKVCTIAYCGENQYGGGFAAPDARLTPAGCLLLERMAESGMVLDLSHAGHQTARDALRYIDHYALDLQVVVTHSGCHAVYPHLRNLPDDVLSRVALLGGIIGLPTVTWLLDEQDDTLDPLYDHLCHLIDLVGVEAVCIGSDGIYTETTPEEDRAQFRMMQQLLDSTNVFQPRFPEESFTIHTPARIRILARLLTEWFGKHAAAQIAGENLISYWETLE